MSNRRFIQVFLVAFFAILMLVGAGNYMIDPYGLHFHNRYEGINNLKPAFHKYSRTIKLFQADAVQPDAIFLGNSRLLYLMPEVAIDKYRAYTYYNFALSSGRVNEMNELLAYAIRNYGIKYVCYGIDFISMSDWEGEYGNTFDLELVRGEKSKFLELVKLHTSTQAIDESYQCVNINITDDGGRNMIIDYNKFGSRSGMERERGFALWGEAYMDEQFGETMKTYTDIYGNAKIKIADFNKDAYKSILDQCQQNNIEYSAFINPLHEDQFDLLVGSKVFPAYVEFLRFLSQNGGIWYFGGVNDITSDKSYFWDTQHPRARLSELITEAMYSASPPPFVNSLFGTFYTEENIDLLINELEIIREGLMAE